MLKKGFGVLRELGLVGFWDSAGAYVRLRGLQVYRAVLGWGSGMFRGCTGLELTWLQWFRLGGLRGATSKSSGYPYRAYNLAHGVVQCVVWAFIEG